MYTKTADGTAYAVSDYAGDGVSVLVPDTYGGLPVTAIESGAFAGARQITAVRLPASVTAIGSSAFTGCKALAEINLPEGVVSIGNYAFAGCESLTSLTLPTTLSLIGCYAFDRCTSLTEITFPADGAWYRTYDPAAETGKETDVSDPEDNAELLRDDWHTYYLKRNTAAEDTVTGA